MPAPQYMLVVLDRLREETPAVLCVVRGSKAAVLRVLDDKKPDPEDYVLIRGGTPLIPSDSDIVRA